MLKVFCLKGPYQEITNLNVKILSYPKDTEPGQVVKLSTSGRLAALLRAAFHRGWCVFESEC